MTSSPINSWQIDGENWKQWQISFSWALKSLSMVTADMKLEDACSLKESYDKPRQHIKKQRHHLPAKVSIVKAMVFPVLMYGCESWTIKNAECWRTDAFELWYWRRFENPLDSKEIMKFKDSSPCLSFSPVPISVTKPSNTISSRGHRLFGQWLEMAKFL